MHQDCARIAPGVHQECTGIAPGVHQDCTRIAPGVPKECTRSAPGVHQAPYAAASLNSACGKHLKLTVLTYHAGQFVSFLKMTVLELE